MDRTESFLESYRKLEKAARAYLGKDDSHPVSTIERLAEFSNIKEKLAYVREVRNFLTHNEKIGGSFAVIPSEQMLLFINNLIKKLESPVRLCDIAVKEQEILTAKIDEPVFSLMKEMERRGFSHIPVISENKVAGVFSMSTVFLYLVKMPECDFKKLTFYDIKDEVGIHSHVTEGFIFLKENETVRGARRICEEYDKKHLRIGLMLLTKTGNENEALRGIVTPWDILSSAD